MASSFCYQVRTTHVSASNAKARSCPVRIGLLIRAFPNHVGSVVKSAHWAVGLFVLGSTLSYEYCQYQRRAERTRMKRTIEIVNDKRREEAAAEKDRQQKLEEERKAAQRRWYKFW